MFTVVWQHHQHISLHYSTSRTAFYTHLARSKLEAIFPQLVTYLRFNHPSFCCLLCLRSACLIVLVHMALF